ncbi:MAG: ABC transporter substrate-binding protein [Acetobacteraceae bacterium]|nr:ABC transporter substrate-binding protein [Acetobacteraceae bacterium]MBV8590232.1 ABC transporter substrate-binding protein [Acetobacteraceae bacterium]
MPVTRRTILGSAAAAAAFRGPGARAQAKPVIRIGVLNDQTGPFQDIGGPGAVAATRQAVKEFRPQAFDVEVIFADHQNKPDVGAGIARQWCDQGVDLLVDLPNSSVALAVNSVVREKNKVLITSSAATTDLTGPQCSPNTVQWTFDVYMLSKAEGTAIVKQGGDSWFIIYADYVFGQQLARETSRFVKEAGGKVLGTLAYPFPGTSDFSSFLLQAQSSGAKVLGFANAGADLINCIKQAREFGMTTSMRVTALEMFISDVHGLGLAEAQGIILCSTFYWDLNDRTRAFTERLLKDRNPPGHPTMDHAGCYAGTLHYLKAATAMGAAKAKADGKAAVAQMKAMPTDDDAFGPGSIRQDGRYMCPAYLFQVKTPDESKKPWDYYKLLQALPADQIWRPLNEGGCPLVKA